MVQEPNTVVLLHHALGYALIFLAADVPPLPYLISALWEEGGGSERHVVSLSHVQP